MAQDHSHVTRGLMLSSKVGKEQGTNGKGDGHGLQLDCEDYSISHPIPGCTVFFCARFLFVFPLDQGSPALCLEMYKLDFIRAAMFSSSAAISFLASHPLIHTHFFLNEHGLTFPVLGPDRAAVAVGSSC